MSGRGVPSVRIWSPSARAAIDAAAADWMARREAGLSAEAQAEFSAWLLADPRHADAVREIERHWQRLQRPRRAGQADELQRAIAVAVARRARRGRRRVLATVAMGTLAAAAAVAVWVRPLALPERGSAAMAVAATDVPTRRELADGSVVELNVGSKIEVTYSAGRRDVRLQQGEAHFIVARDPLRPFVVTAGSVAVRAVGTEFAVSLQAEQVAVLVTEGRVAVERPAADAVRAAGPDGKTASLAEPQVLALIEAGNRVSVPVEPAAAIQPSPVGEEELNHALGWRGLRVEFTATPLAEILARFNRRNPVQISLASSELGALRVSGLFRADDPEGFARLLELSAGLRAERVAPDRIVLRP